MSNRNGPPPEPIPTTILGWEAWEKLQRQARMMRHRHHDSAPAGQAPYAGDSKALDTKYLGELAVRRDAAEAELAAITAEVVREVRRVEAKGGARRLEAVARLLGVPRSTIYRWLRA